MLTGRAQNTTSFRDVSCGYVDRIPPDQERSTKPHEQTRIRANNSPSPRPDNPMRNEQWKNGKHLLQLGTHYVKREGLRTVLPFGFYHLTLASYGLHVVSVCGPYGNDHSGRIDFRLI